MKGMRFWRLHEPEYGSDYRSSFVNGALEHPFGLPGVACDACGETWAGSRILPHECPESLRGSRHLNDRWPVPVTQHKALQNKVRQAFSSVGHDVGDLRPGDTFQPCYLDVPSRPRADFLWAHLGGVVVSSRVRLLFESLPIEQVVFCPVTLRKIGTREASLPAQVPASGEPEDLIREAPLLGRTDSVGPYYEMVLLSESGRPPGGDPVSICSSCGRETIDNSLRRLVMEPPMWPGTDAFFLATTLHIIITDRLRVRLKKLRATNADFSECGAA